MVARSTDARLTAVERAQCGENVQAIDNALGLLRPDNTIAPNRRNQQATVLDERTRVTIHISNKYEVLSAAEFYDGLDLMYCASLAILEGVGDFATTLSDGL